MTFEQTIEIPASRKVQCDGTLPDDIPQGQMKVVLRFMPRDGQYQEAAGKPVDTQPKVPLLMDDELAALVAEAGRRAERERTDPVYRAEVIERFRKCQEGSPIFGGISAEDFKKECNDEWENRF
jgi:hypothetical protein